MTVTDTPNTSYTPLPTLDLYSKQQDATIAALRIENTALRTTLIDVTGQRSALQQELDRVLRERAA